MSAERLREAARLIRERAQAATPGPWHTINQYVWRDGADQCPGESPVVRDGVETEADAEHIASWHPVVALAVADLLDALAGEPVLYEDNPVVRKALAVADAYLGGAE